VKLCENIETTSETKTKNLTTTRNTAMNVNSYFNYLQPIIFETSL